MNFTQQLWSVKEWGRVMATGNEYVVIVHEATNEEKWGPTGPQMEAVCNAYPRGGGEIIRELRNRLNNRDKAWRPCYKSLLVLDYLARNIADRFLPEICSLVPLLRTISTSFYYTNPKGIDHGVSVRQRAAKLADLLSDGLQLREERVVAAQTKEKLAHNASDGGGPTNRGAYAGAYSGGYDRYNGGGAHDRRDPYSGFGGSSGGGGGATKRPNHDTYRPSPPPQATPSRPRTKEEVERYDMEMALRMQRDEERRSGVSAEQLEEMYANKVRQRRGEMARPKAMSNDDDEALARRLQEEEENRARREGRSLPTLSSDRPSPTPEKAAGPASQAQPEPAKPKQPDTSALDDLFAPAPAAPAAPAAAAAQGYPFDSFLNPQTSPQQAPPANMPQNAWGQQPPSGAWGAPSSSPPQQQQQAANAWGQQQSPQPPQQWGQFQQQATPPQPPIGNSGNASGWGQPVMAQQQQQPPQDAWGQFQQSQPQQQQQQQQGGWGQPAPQQFGSWSQGQPSAATTGTAYNSTSANPGGNLDNMFGTLNQFSNQQQRK